VAEGISKCSRELFLQVIISMVAIAAWKLVGVVAANKARGVNRYALPPFITYC